MNKRFIATLLLCFTLTAFTAGCAGETANDPADTGSAETTTAPEETRIYPDLPDVKYNGSDYRFYSWLIDAWHTWDDLDTDELNGEIINDSVYNRNATIESKYNIKITSTYDQYLTYEANVAKNVKAGDDFAEVLISMGHDIPRLYNQSVFYNLHNVPFLDFDKPWWDSNAVESFTLAGYMPFGVSDLTLLDKGVTSCVYFNKQLATDFSLGNLYELVYNNEWTFDKLIELGKKVSQDLNGDSKYDQNDVFGIVADDDPVFMLFNGGGGRHITKDAEGYPQLSFENEYNFTMIKYYLENIMYDEQLTYNSSFNDTIKNCVDMFIDNQGLFLFKYINTSVRLRNMETDFGILPIPKYQSSQDSYGCAVSVFGTNLISVPISAKDLEKIGIILEALSAESTYTVMPALYDVVLKDKFTRDVESTDMLDIIFASRVYDVGDYYGLANFPDNFLRITGKAGHLTGIQQTSDIASFYTKREKALVKALDELIKIIDEWRELEA